MSAAHARRSARGCSAAACRVPTQGARTTVAGKARTAHPDGGGTTRAPATETGQCRVPADTRTGSPCARRGGSSGCAPARATTPTGGGIAPTPEATGHSSVGWCPVPASTRDQKDEGKQANRAAD